MKKTCIFISALFLGSAAAFGEIEIIPLAGGGGAGAGDNLGDHTATEDIDVSGFSLLDVSSITSPAGSLNITGSVLIGTGPTNTAYGIDMQKGAPAGSETQFTIHVGSADAGGYIQAFTHDPTGLYLGGGVAYVGTGSLWEAKATQIGLLQIRDGELHFNSQYDTTPGDTYSLDSTTDWLTVDGEGFVSLGSTQTAALDIGGGVETGTGDVDLIGSDGKINGPLSSTILDDLSGANLLNISSVSANITQTWSGVHTFNNQVVHSTYVGVGITPTKELDIYSGVTANPTIRLRNVNTGTTESDGSYIGLTTSGAADLNIINVEARQIKLGTTNTTRQTIFATGEVAIATNVAAGRFHVLAADNTPGQTITFNADQASVDTSDVYINFNSLTGNEGSISGTGVAGVLAFNTFTGSHYSRVLGEEPELLMLMDSTGEIALLPSGTAPKEQLVSSVLCKTAKSKKAWGFYGGRDKNKRAMILSLGTGFAWVYNDGREVEIGDYLTSTDLAAGHVVKQDESALMVFTVAKALQPVKWKSGEKRRKIAVTYHCG